MQGGVEHLKWVQWAIARLLVLALLLPAFLGLLPKPALTAEQALAAALAASRCSSDQGSPAAPVQHDSSCVLCQAGCLLAAPALLPGTVAEGPRRTAQTLPCAFASSQLHPAHWRFEGVPRGPPRSV